MANDLGDIGFTEGAEVEVGVASFTNGQELHVGWWLKNSIMIGVES